MTLKAAEARLKKAQADLMKAQTAYNKAEQAKAAKAAIKTKETFQETLMQRVIVEFTIQHGRDITIKGQGYISGINGENGVVKSITIIGYGNLESLYEGHGLR